MGKRSSRGMVTMRSLYQDDITSVSENNFNGRLRDGIE